MPAFLAPEGVFARPGWIPVPVALSADTWDIMPSRA